MRGSHRSLRLCAGVCLIAHAHAACHAACASPCDSLNGLPHHDCSSCSTSSACHPAADGYAYRGPRGSCVDHDPTCEAAAAAGECKTKQHKLSKCPFSCNVCPEIDHGGLSLPPFGNCTRPRPAIVQEGSIDRMFRRLLQGFPQYSPRALSIDPWVVSLDNLISDDEIAQILKLCDGGFDVSVTQKPLHRPAVRSSDTCWGNDIYFRTDPLVQRLHGKIAEVTLVPSTHAESLQVVRYAPGQYAAGRSNHPHRSQPPRALAA